MPLLFVGTVDAFVAQLIISLSSSCATYCSVCCSICLYFVLSLVAAMVRSLDGHGLWLGNFADVEFLLMADGLVVPNG
jgi:hypothetical protein